MYTGLLQNGKKHGRWVFRYASGSVREGLYVDRQEARPLGSLVQEGPYVDGERHGRWVFRWADGAKRPMWTASGTAAGSFATRPGPYGKGPMWTATSTASWVFRWADGIIVWR